MDYSVFIADDDNDVVELLALRCEAMGLEVDSANNAMTALGKIEESLPDVVILDVDMPYGDGLGVCEMMARHSELQDIPVIMLTAKSDEKVIRRCHEFGAYYVLKCPNVWSRVEPLLRELREQKSSEPQPEATDCVSDAEESNVVLDSVFALLGVEQSEYETDDREPLQLPSDEPWVLSIEDDPDVALALRLRLNDWGLQLVQASEGTAGYRQAFLNSPRAILLDYELPQGNGDYVLRRLKESPATRDIPVIVLTGRREASIERQMMGLGAHEFLNKPIDWVKLRSALGVCLEAEIPKPELHA